MICVLLSLGYYSSIIKRCYYIVFRGGNKGKPGNEGLELRKLLHSKGKSLLLNDQNHAISILKYVKLNHLSDNKQTQSHKYGVR